MTYYRQSPPDPDTTEARMDEAMYYLRRLAMAGFTGYFPLRLVDGRLDRSSWKRIVHVAREYLAQQEVGV